MPFGNHLYEVDEFLSENKGLILAEVELNHEDERFEKPEWLGEEVTGQIQYYNSQLSKNRSGNGSQILKSSRNNQYIDCN